jgi:hypothetical protein
MGITFLSPNPPGHLESESQNLWSQVAQIPQVRSPTLRVYSECGWSSDRPFSLAQAFTPGLRGRAVGLQAPFMGLAWVFSAPGVAEADQKSPLKRA